MLFAVVIAAEPWPDSRLARVDPVARSVAAMSLCAWRFSPASVLTALSDRARFEDHALLSKSLPALLSTAMPARPAPRRPDAARLAFALRIVVSRAACCSGVSAYGFENATLR